MKKFTLLMVALLLSVVGVNATEIWTGSCTIGAWSGSSVGVEKKSFSSANAGDVIKVTFSAYAEKDEKNEDVTYWQYSLGQKDNGWTGLTGFSGGDLTKGQESASYILTETNVTELKNYGLAVNGRYITVTKVELISTPETLWTGTQVIGNWDNNVNLSYENKGKLSEIFMNDKIRITYKDAGEDATVRVANPKDYEKYEDASEAVATSGDNQTFEYTITSAVILEKIQQNGILGRGKNITITKIELLKEEGRYDAVPVTIGEDGIATFGSSKKLDFSGTDITPYYASAVESGKVTLTPVSNQTTWDNEGYILKGDANTYNIPVINDAFWPSGNFLKSTNDYGTTVTASTDGTYHYIFAKKSSGTPAFYKLATAAHNLAAHKAYLETTEDITPTSNAPLMLDFGNGTTAIMDVFQDEMKQQPVQEDNVYYTLQGTRVQNPTKGLYILNGKKIIVK